MEKEEDAASLTERLNLNLTEEAAVLMGPDHGIPLGISIGVAFSGESCSDYETLFGYADGALYEVKRNGKHG